MGGEKIKSSVLDSKLEAPNNHPSEDVKDVKYMNLMFKGYIQTQDNLGANSYTCY